MSPAFIEATLAGARDDASQLIDAKLPERWPPDEGHLPSTMQMRLEQMARDPASKPWLLRAMVLRADRRLVGWINFHGAPNDEGQAELGYTVLMQYRRRSFATEAALAMMDWARKEHGVRRFLVSISPANLPSLAMAAKLGAVRIGSQVDEVDGEEYVFELVVD